jgi:hypothetical protein
MATGTRWARVKITGCMRRGVRRGHERDIPSGDVHQGSRHLRWRRLCGTLMRVLTIGIGSGSENQVGATARVARSYSYALGLHGAVNMWRF